MLEATGVELRSLAQEVEALKSTEQALQRARATLNDRERELEVSRRSSVRCGCQCLKPASFSLGRHFPPWLGRMAYCILD
jgi:hypothetical protein